MQDDVDAIDPERRPLFGRVRQLVLDAHPDAEMLLSYKVPTDVVGHHRRDVAAWSHGLSFYGRTTDGDAGLTDRQADLVTNKGILKLPPAATERIDDELKTFLAAALGG